MKYFVKLKGHENWTECGKDMYTKSLSMDDVETKTEPGLSRFSQQQ